MKTVNKAICHWLSLDSIYPAIREDLSTRTQLIACCASYKVLKDLS